MLVSSRQRRTTRRVLEPNQQCPYRSRRNQVARRLPSLTLLKILPRCVPSSKRFVPRRNNSPSNCRRRQTRAGSASPTKPRRRLSGGGRLQRLSGGSEDRKSTRLNSSHTVIS